MEDREMTTEEQLDYLTSKYEKNDLYYIKRLINSKKTIPLGELAGRIISVDKDYDGGDWNLLQILTNIDMIIPLEDREG